MIKKCVKCGKEFDAKRKDRKYCDECSKNRHSPDNKKENKIHVVYKGKYSRKQFWVNPVWDYHHDKVNREITQKIVYLYTKKDWYGMGTVHGFDAVDTDSELRFTKTYEETNHFEREISFVPSVEHRLSKEYVHTTLKEKPTLIGEHLYEITIQHERILYCLEDGDNEKLKKYLIDRPGIICVDIEPLISEVNVKSKINKDNRTEKLKSKPKKIKKNIRIFKSNNYPEKVNWNLVQFDWNKKPDVVLNLNDGYYTGWIPGVDFIVVDKNKLGAGTFDALLIGTVDIKDDFSPSSDMCFSNSAPEEGDIHKCENYDTGVISNEKPAEADENWICDAVTLYRAIDKVNVDIDNGDVKQTEWYDKIKYVIKPLMTIDEGNVTFYLSKSKLNYYCVLPDKVLFIDNKKKQIDVRVFDRFPSVKEEDKGGGKLKDI